LEKYYFTVFLIMVAEFMENHLGQSWWGIFEQHAVQKNYIKNQTLDFQEQTIDYFGVVTAGHVEAIVTSENGDQVWIGEFKTGDFIGHMAFLGDLPSQFELVTTSKTTLYRLSAVKARELMDIDTGLRDAVINDFATQLHVMTRSLVEAFALSAKGRICAELIRLSREIGIEPNKTIIRPNPVYVDLARRVNSTRETVSRTVSDLQKMGIVSRQPGALIVEQPDKLAGAFK